MMITIVVKSPKNKNTVLIPSMIIYYHFKIVFFDYILYVHDMRKISYIKFSMDIEIFKESLVCVETMIQFNFEKRSTFLLNLPIHFDEVDQSIGG